MAAPAQTRSGSLVDVEASEAPSESLFGVAAPGVGEVHALNLPQVAQRSDPPGAGHDPRDLALLVRPERYQDRVEREQKALSARAVELEAEAQRLQALAASLDERDTEVTEREAQLEALVLEAVETRVDGLAEERLAIDRARLVAAVTQLEAVAHGLVDQARLDLLDLAVKIAAKVIGAELQSRPKLLVGLIRSALEAVAPSGVVTLHLHPADHAILLKRGPQVLGRLPAAVQIKLQADEQVDRGGVIIATAGGRVDATIAKRLARVGVQLAELAEG